MRGHDGFRRRDPLCQPPGRQGSPCLRVLNSDDEEYRVLLPFIKEGFQRGDKAVHVINPDHRSDHVRRLDAAGIDSTAVQRSGQLELRSNTETYLRDGSFDQNRMVEVFEELASANAKGRFPVSRIVCHMDWAVEGRSHLYRLFEFESRVNDVWARHEDAVICVYDLAKCGGATVLDMVRTHPLVVIGGILQQNPFFVPPAEFLRELRERRGQNRRNVEPPSGPKRRSPISIGSVAVDVAHFLQRSARERSVSSGGEAAGSGGEPAVPAPAEPSPSAMSGAHCSLTGCCAITPRFASVTKRRFAPRFGGSSRYLESPQRLGRIFVRGERTGFPRSSRRRLRV